MESNYRKGKKTKLRLSAKRRKHRFKIKWHIQQGVVNEMDGFEGESSWWQGNSRGGSNFPLYMLVPNCMIGPIIGVGGSNVQLISRESGARVIVQRRANAQSQETAITIHGNPDSCTNACKKILEVINASTTNRREICLKILAHMNLISRFIGIGGRTIKRIMQDTDTKITVSWINDINSLNLERTITVKGGIENMARAESLISANLRQSYENDRLTLAPPSIMFPGLRLIEMRSTGRGGYRGELPSFPPPIHAPIVMATADGGAYRGAPPPFPPPIHAPIVMATADGGAYRGAPPPFPPPIHAPIVMATVDGGAYRGAPPPFPPPISAPIAGQGEAQQGAEDSEETTYLFIPNTVLEATFIMEVVGEVGLTLSTAAGSSKVNDIMIRGSENLREVLILTEQPPASPAGASDTDSTLHIEGPFYNARMQSALWYIRRQAPGRDSRDAAGSASYDAAAAAQQ